MKKILIVGSSSYIGNNIFGHFNEKKTKYIIESISLRNNTWKNHELSKYDHIIYLVGLAHSKGKNGNKDNYYKINYELTKEFVNECKKQSVNNIIYFSTMSVFGDVRGEINENTPIHPNNHYGKSKLLAENYIVKNFENSDTIIQIIRPPMVYGYKSPGNYSLLSGMVKKVPFFPKYKNKRSMIDINNLCLFIEELINKDLRAIYYHPQNSYYINTSLLVEEIVKISGKKVIFININKIIMEKLFFFNVFKKLFDDLYYSSDFSDIKNFTYNEVGFEESINKAERK